MQIFSYDPRPCARAPCELRRWCFKATGWCHMTKHYLCLVQFLPSFAPREEIKGSSGQKIKGRACS